MANKNTGRYEDIMCIFWIIGSVFGESFKAKTASDFFFIQNASKLTLAQELQGSKIEMQVHSQLQGKEISLGSLNIHGTHFTSSQNIQLESRMKALSLCLGFGIERMLKNVLSNRSDDVL